MIIKYELGRSINMSRNPGLYVNVLDLEASADEMPFVAELTENVRSFAANYPKTDTNNTNTNKEKATI